LLAQPHEVEHVDRTFAVVFAKFAESLLRQSRAVSALVRAMRRRSNRDRKSTKTRGEEAATPKRGNASKALRRHSSSVTHSETQVARLTRKLQDSLAREDATSEVLRVISASSSDPKPVFGAILDNATRICEANFGILMLCEGDAFLLGDLS
jgi:hypothetical protein